MFTLRLIFFTWYYAFFDWDGIGDPVNFSGLANFLQVARDPYFWNAFKNTFIFMAGVAPGQLVLGLLLALFLNMKIRGAAGYRTVYFLPVITTGAIIGIIMPLIFSPISGPVNALLGGAGILAKPVDWLGNPKLTMATVIAVVIWKWTGTYMGYFHWTLMDNVEWAFGYTVRVGLVYVAFST